MATTGEEWTELAKDLAKAEKELGIEQWVIISIERHSHIDSSRQELYSYNVPRELWIKYDWVFNWRRARYICKYPQDRINLSISFYDKTRGLELGIGSKLGKLTSAKAQVTKVERKMSEYIQWSKQNNIFFNEGTDEMLIKAQQKLAQKKANVQLLEEKIKELVKDYSPSHKL